MAGLHIRRRFRKYFRVTMHIFSRLVFPLRTHVFYFGRTCVVGPAGLVIFIIFSYSCALQSWFQRQNLIPWLGMRRRQPNWNISPLLSYTMYCDSMFSGRQWRLNAWQRSWSTRSWMIKTTNMETQKLEFYRKEFLHLTLLKLLG